MNDYIILITLAALVALLAGSWWAFETIRVVVLDALDHLVKWIKERFG